MSNKKLLIIEDNKYHWKKLSETLKKHVSVYPKTDKEYAEFKELFSKLASSQDNVNYQEALRDKIIEVNPTIALIDVCLIDNNFNRTGEMIADKIIKSMNIQYKLFTTYATSKLDLDASLYFRKYENGAWSMDNIINVRVFSWLAEHFDLETKVLQDTFKKLMPSFGKDPEKRPVDKLITFIANIITIVFSLVFILLLIAGPLLLFKKIWNKDIEFGLLHLAEYSFLILLPFTIAASFYAFYERGFKRFIVGQAHAPFEIDDVSNLMTLCKKLFVSSLISYSFIKGIEIIAPDEKVKASIDNTQLYWLLGWTLLLIFYFIYLNRKH